MAETPPGRTAPHPLAHKWVPVTLALVGAGATALASVLSLLFADLRSSTRTFSLIHPVWIGAAAWTAVAAGALLVAWGVWRRRSDVVWRTLVGAGFAAVAFFCGAGTLGWKVHDRRELPDGRTYIWFIQHQWLDPPDYLARLESRGWFADEYTLVGKHWWGDSPRLLIVAPRGEPPRIRLLSNGVVAVVGYGCVLVVEGTPPGAGADDWVEKAAYVATFALIGATGEGDPDDVARIRDAIRRAKERGLTTDSPDSDLRDLPGDGELANALDHANPWVRETARTFILAGGEALYPLATFALR